MMFLRCFSPDETERQAHLQLRRVGNWQLSELQEGVGANPGGSPLRRSKIARWRPTTLGGLTTLLSADYQTI